MTPHKFIKKYSIPCSTLAALIKMKRPTFQEKLNPNQPKYRFSEPEQIRLIQAIRELAKDAEEVKF